MIRTPVKGGAKAKAKCSPGSGAKRRSGDTKADCKRAVEANMLQEIMSTLKGNPSQIYVVYSQLQKRMKIEQNLSSENPEVASWGKLSIVVKIEPQFKVAWVVEHSDLTASDCCAMMEKDGNSIDNIIAMAVQFPVKMRLPLQAATKEVMKKWWNHRNTTFGNRIARVKAEGGLWDEFDVDYSKISVFKLTFNSQDFLESVEHKPSKIKAENLAKYRISKDIKFVDGFSDVEAYFELPPLPPIKVYTLFAEDDFEWEHYYVVPGNGSPTDDVKKAFDGYETESKQKSGGDDVKEKVARFTSDKSKQQMSKARELAQKALARKKELKTVSLS